MLMRSAPSACVIPASTPGRSGTWTRSCCSVPRSGYASASMRPRFRPASRDPAREEAGVARVERLLQLLDPAAVLAQRLAYRAGVLEKDVDPDPRVRSGDARHVPQRSPRRGGQRLVPVDPRRAGLVDEQVGERMREVAGQRDEPVVDGRVDGDGRGAERGDEAVDEAVRLGRGLGAGREEPRGALEQVGARMGGAVRLGAADGVTADEARRRGRGRHARLGRADVGDRAAVRARGQDGLDRGDELRHRRCNHRQPGAVQRPLEAGRLVDRAALGRDGERPLVRVVAGHVVAPLPGGEPDGGADQAGADDGDAHPPRLEADSLRNRHAFAHNWMRRWPHGRASLSLDRRTPRRAGGARDAPGRPGSEVRQPRASFRRSARIGSRRSRPRCASSGER